MGAGWQSSALYFMSATGFIPVCFDAAIFEDTGREYKGTYDYLKYMVKWSEENDGPPIIWSGRKSLYVDLLNKKNTTGGRFASIPLYVKNKDGSIGTMRRQCTNEYKLIPFEKDVRKIQGLGKGKRNIPTNIYIGLTVDELRRISVNSVKKWVNYFPLAGGHVVSNEGHKIKDELDFRMLSHECPKWLNENGFKIPIRSKCTFCPYQSNEDWQAIKISDPKEFALLVDLDKKLRDSISRGIINPCYLHRSCEPLDEIDFTKAQISIDFFECSGTCNT